ncbi:prepilin peptidase, partial [Acidobacteriota bacterium]
MDIETGFASSGIGIADFPVPIVFWYVVIILFGLALGSFLNVCIYRLPKNLSVVKPRSFCPACEEMIRWYDNIPVFSYLFLTGKCRHCSARIPLRYPIVEAVTAILFLATFLRDGFHIIWLFDLFFMAAMIVLIFTDIDHQILPNEITYTGIVLGLLSSLFRDELTFLESLIAAVLG